MPLTDKTVQTIVNVIETDHGTVFDLACSSGGMFVQSSHFIEQEGGDTAKKVVFYGQEKNRDTIRIAKMNLAIRGLDGQIAHGDTVHNDLKTDFILANPPFNISNWGGERLGQDNAGSTARRPRATPKLSPAIQCNGPIARATT